MSQTAEGVTSTGPSSNAGPAEGAPQTAFGLAVEDGAPGLSDAPPSRTPASSAASTSSPSQSAPGASQSEGGDPASAAAAAAPAPTPSAFKFMGREFRDQAHAEQSFRTLEGLGRKHHEMRLSLVERDNAIAQLRSEVERLRTGSAPQPQPAQPAGESKAEAGAAGKEVVQVFEQLATKFGLPTAMSFFMAEQQKATQAAVAEAVAAVKSELSGLVQPLQAAHAQAQEEQYADQLLGGLAALRTAEGSQAFPELSDHSKVAEISSLMSELGFEREHMLSPKVVMAAVGLYRMKHGWAASQVASGSGSPNTTPTASALAAAAAVAGVSGDPPARPPAPQSEAERIRAEMLRAPGGAGGSSFGIMP